MRERTVEAYLLDRCKKIKALCLKFESPGTSGVPDRIIFFKGRVYLVEVKRKGESPRALQVYIFELFRTHGILIRVVDDYYSVNLLIHDIQAT